MTKKVDYLNRWLNACPYCRGAGGNWKAGWWKLCSHCRGLGIHTIGEPLAMLIRSNDANPRRDR